MGVFARLAQLIKANLNDLIDRAEDPSKMLSQVIVDMNAQLINAKKQVAVAIADEKHLSKQAEQEAANAAEWERRAMLAIRQGDDALARDALARKKHHADLAHQFEEQWQKQKASVDHLKTALRMLNDKIEDAKRKKNLLEARIARGKAQQAIQNTLTGLKDNSAFDQFDRLEKKVDRIEAEAEAGVELAEEYTGDRLAQQFRELEQNSGVDDDLVAMKRKMGMAPPAPAPTPAPKQVRVKEPTPPPAAVSGPASEEDRDELAHALEEIQAEELRERERVMKR
jgi:phage shock protein A